jgi:molybdopterin-binding protein
VPQSGTLEDITFGDILAHVPIRVGDNVIESVITRRSAEERTETCDVVLACLNGEVAAFSDQNGVGRPTGLRLGIRRLLFCDECLKR